MERRANRRTSAPSSGRRDRSTSAACEVHSAASAAIPNARHSPSAPVATPLPTGRSRLAGEVAEVADRLEAMELPPAARAEIARLRRLARDAGA